MRKFMNITVVSLILVFCATMSVSAIERPPAEVVKAAEAGLVNFSMLIKDRAVKSPAPAVAKMEKSISTAAVDFGFRVYTVEPAKLMGSDVNTLAGAVTPMNIWRFIVKSEGKAVSLVTVAKVEGKWQAVSFGGEGIAGEMEQLKKTWSEEAGYEMRFVRIHQAKADVVQVRRAKDVLGYTPLESAKRTFEFESVKFDSTTLLQDYDVVMPLKKLINKSEQIKPVGVEEK